MRDWDPLPFPVHLTNFNLLRWRGGLFDDADERERGAFVDVVLLVGQDEGLWRHHF